mmetsp:Transcript_114049/g.346910  ORF Transcript_114049/g.346910 Transcript_114049/m.346910 type:complete len:266 (+) Transcript_114049:98-895(+)
MAAAGPRGARGQHLVDALEEALLDALLQLLALLEEAGDGDALLRHLVQLVQQPLHQHLQAPGRALHRVVDVEDVLDGERLLEVGEALHEVVDGELAVALCVQQDPGPAHLLHGHLHAQGLHVLQHARLLHEALELLLVQQPVAVGVRVVEGRAEELHEVLVPLLLLRALRLLARGGGHEHLVGGHAREHGDHGPGRKGDEDHEEELHLRAKLDDGPGDLVPVVLGDHLEERQQRGGHVPEGLPGGGLLLRQELRRLVVAPEVAVA